MNTVPDFESDSHNTNAEKLSGRERFGLWLGGLAIVGSVAAGAAYEVGHFIDDFRNPDYSGISDNILK